MDEKRWLNLFLSSILLNNLFKAKRKKERERGTFKYMNDQIEGQICVRKVLQILFPLFAVVFR